MVRDNLGFGALLFGCAVAVTRSSFIDNDKSGLAFQTLCPKGASSTRVHSSATVRHGWSSVASPSLRSPNSSRATMKAGESICDRRRRSRPGDRRLPRRRRDGESLIATRTDREG
jgi:hypothetical protein